MTLLIENLAAFNRKERFHLLSFALGIKQAEVALSDQLKREVAKITGVEISPPVFLAMDYHLDWIYAALEVTKAGKRLKDVKFDRRKLGPVFERGQPGRITGRQADVDLLVAFQISPTGRTSIVMIEAKSETSWSNSQLKSKSERLSAIFGADNSEWREFVEPCFVLTSPRRPKNLKYEVLPPWAHREEMWFELPVKDSTGNQDLFQVVRCTNSGKDDSTDLATHWKLE